MAFDSRRGRLVIFGGDTPSGNNADGETWEWNGHAFELRTPTDPEGDGSRFSLEQVLRERTADLGIPVLAGLPVGHGNVNAALPLGVRARLDGDRGRLSLIDGGR